MRMKTFDFLSLLIIGIFGSQYVHATRFLDFSRMDFDEAPSSRFAGVSGENIQRSKQAIEVVQRSVRSIENLSTIQVLSFRYDNMTSTSFNYLTTQILPYFQERQQETPNLKILDLSHNQLDQRAARGFQDWLVWNENLYIDVTNNPIGVKNVKKIYEEFLSITEDGSTAQALMGKIIFVPRNYLPEARGRVKIYKDLANDGMIPKDWAQIHDHYYALEEKKDFEIFLKQKDYNECMQKVAALTIGIKPVESQQGDVTEEQEGFDFNSALKMIAPPTSPY